MLGKTVVQGLAAVWLLLFLASFLVLQTTDTDGSVVGDLSRIVAFLTWQGLAFVVAAVGAFAARHAARRGVAGLKLTGYGPLAVSVFLVGSFVAILAVRFYLVPALESSGLI
jgi:uncharacterized membrane protein